MTDAVDVHGLKKSYATGSRFWQKRSLHHALDGIDLVIKKGEIFGLVGRNGYGKTTLIKCVAGLLAPTAGGVSVWGHDTMRHPIQVRRLIGWVGAEERSFYLRLTGLQNLLFFARLQGMDEGRARQRIEYYSDRLRCSQLLHKRLHEHSTGNRQRFSIIRGLLHDPKVLILDEPTRSLDPFSSAELRAMLREWVEEDARRSILITSHQLDEVEHLSDRIAILGRGTMGACGSLEELRAKLGAGAAVGIALRQALLDSSIQKLKEGVCELSLERRGDFQVVTFQRKPDDDRLQFVIECLVSARAEIVSISHRELPLQDLIDRLEGSPQ